MKKTIQNLLSLNSFWVLNKKLTIELGFDASLLLSDLISRHQYFENRDMLDQSGGFFCSREEIEKSTGLSAYKQRIAIDFLTKKELLSVKRMGNPARNFYYLSYEHINQIITC